MNEEKTIKGIKAKKVDKIKLWKVVQYRGCMVYIRQLQKEYFEYLVVFDGQVFTSYVIMKPREGKKKLSKSDETKTAGMMFAGAIATIDTLLEDPEKAERENVKPKEVKIDKKTVSTLH